MAVLYNIYLSKLSTTPDDWDDANDADYNHANGWVKIICSFLDDKFSQKNKVRHVAGHTQIRIVVGKFIQSVNLGKCIITQTGNTESSDYYNAVKMFLVRHAAVGVATEHAYPLYLHAYTSPTIAVKWIDIDEVLQPYLKVQVKGFNFKVDGTGIYRGTIQLEEA